MRISYRSLFKDFKDKREIAPKIMQVVGAFQNDCYHLVVMERCEGITLFQCVELNSALPESVARMISKQVEAISKHITFSHY